MQELIADRAVLTLENPGGREQFVVGVDLILAGIETVNRAGEDTAARQAAKPAGS